jgi:hypothetical protein
LALLPCLAGKTGHKNKDAAEACAVYLDRTLDNLLLPGAGVIGDIVNNVEGVLGPLLRGLSLSLSAKSPKAKAAAKQSAARIQAALGGSEKFAVVVDAGAAALAAEESTTLNSLQVG